VSRVFLPFAPTPDRDSKPWWDALAAGEFRLQRCQACGAYRWPARAICNRCRSFEAAWETLDGAGTVASWIRTHQAFAPPLREAVPYVVVQIRLDVQEDVLLIGGWLAERDPVSGEPVALEIVAGPDGSHLPCWRPTRPSAESGTA
jgi:uncharacterized OB-fold protein